MISVTVTLPFPDKALWPNGRPHWATKAAAFRKHKAWAFAAIRGERPEFVSSRVAVALTVHPKTRNRIDADNCVSSCKAYLDGIALALGVDDSTFDAPTVTLGEPVKGGLFKVAVTYETQR